MSIILGTDLDAQFPGDVEVASLGSGVNIAEGSNARMGLAHLAGGTITVSNNTVTANTRIFLSNNASSGTVGAVYVSARTPGVSFTITSNGLLGGDTSFIAWELKEPL